MVHFLHHLIGAVMLFSVLHAAEHRHMLEWLDAVMIRVAGQGGGAAASPSAQEQASRPSIVMIGRDAFETVFDDRSPLPRDRLAELLAQIDPRRTRVLAVDIDLAPSVMERAADTARPLDAALAALVARGTAVVLGLPPAAGSTPGATLKWVQGRCADGIRFGGVQLHQRLGVVSRVVQGTPTLASVAFAAAGTHHGASTICDLARTAHEEEAFYDAIEHAGAGEHGGEEPESIPLSGAASNWATLQGDTHAVQLLDGHVAIEDAGKLRRVVFLGGAYNEGERMMTVGGEAWGVQVHAASFTSMVRDTRDVLFWVAALADIVIGVLFGYGFYWMWFWFQRIDNAVGSARPGLAWAGKFIGGRVVLLFLWMLSLSTVYLLIAFCAWMYSSDVWLNPGPIGIGMLLHTLSLRTDIIREAAGAHHHGGTTEPAGHDASHSSPAPLLRAAVRHLYMHHPGSILVQLPVIAAALLAAAF